MIKTTVKAIEKHPSVIVVIGVIMLVGAVFNMFIPVMAMVIGIINMTGGDFFDSILALLQMLIDTQNIVVVFAATLSLSLLLSVAVGLLLPGYLLTVNDSLISGPGRKGLFRMGIRKYFFRFFLISIRTALLAVIVILFLLISSIPAIIITRLAFSSAPELMIAAVFIDIMTVAVFFAGLSFFSVYIYMWYIASLTDSKKPFRTGKEVADRKFWRIALGLLVFDVIFAVGLFLIYMVNNQIFRYISGWIFTTAFFTTLAVYLVKFFRDSSRFLRDSSQPSIDKANAEFITVKRPPL